MAGGFKVGQALCPHAAKLRQWQNPFSKSKSPQDRGRILAQIEDGCHDEASAVDAVENAVRETPHEQTRELPA
jgi:hypothetical protein